MTQPAPAPRAVSRSAPRTPHPAATGTYPADPAYQAVQALVPLDGEGAGLIWRLLDDYTTLLDLIVQARTAAGHGPGQQENHVITRNRLSREPVRLRSDGQIADAEYVQLRRLAANTRKRLRTLTWWLDDQLAGNTGTDDDELPCPRCQGCGTVPAASVATNVRVTSRGGSNSQAATVQVDG